MNALIALAEAMNAIPKPKEFWPGTDIVKSMESGFIVGYTGIPHGYIPGAAARPPKKKKPNWRSPRQPAAFGTVNGTMELSKRRA